LSSTGLSAAAGGIAAFAASRAAEAERRREVDPDVMAAVVDAGFARHFAPASAGGAEGGFAELVDAVGVLGRACPASSWCASLIAGIARMAGAFLPPEGQAEVWAAGPDTVLIGSVTPAGRARRASGGWLVSGRWAYMSGVAGSDWALVCAVLQSGTSPGSKVFAVPRSVYEVEDTWFSVGMCATGSNTLVLDEVFVPDHLAFDRAQLFAGHAGQDARSLAACYRAPLQAVNGLIFAAPGVGAAQGAVRLFAEHFAEKLGSALPLPGTAGVQGVRASAELALARAAGEADAAGLLLDRAARQADDGCTADPLITARNLRDCSLAVDLSVTAADRVFRQAGTRGQSSTAAMQRFWRDVNVIATHVAVQFEPAARNYVDQLFKA
jgi:two-component flavin-dependent monooxygenase/oxygenase LndZ5